VLVVHNDLNRRKQNHNYLTQNNALRLNIKYSKFKSIIYIYIYIYMNFKYYLMHISEK